MIDIIICLDQSLLGYFRTQAFIFRLLSCVFCYIFNIFIEA